METAKPSIFDKAGLEVVSGDVEVGQTYPIYGMITKVVNESPGHVEVELNFSIKALMSIPDEKKVQLLKERAFEPGIFVSTVVSTEEEIIVDCSTVVFGKRQEYHA